MIINHIDRHMMKEVVYSFSLYDRDITVYFVVESGVEEYDFNTYIETLCVWLYILNKYASGSCSQTLKVYFYFTSLEKRLPESKIHVLDETNVNTAFTTSCPKDSEIVVFRKEEWFKVFIHETFHSYGLDFSSMNNEMVHECIGDIYDVDSDINAYESYAEFWAEIMNALFCSYHSLKDKNDIDGFLSNAEIYINLERTYTLFQLAKTLDFMGLRYEDLYSKSSHSAMLRENMYKEKTNVLAYFVIKGVLLNHYQSFLNWCNENNTELLNFKKTENVQKQFCRFIEKNYKSRGLLNGIDESMEFLSRLKKKRVNNKYVLTNMRMTICELG
jgi:hypothetical protein